MENTVFLELARNGYKPNRNIFYHETRTGAETDLLIKTGNKLRIIEVAYEPDEDHIRLLYAPQTN